MMHLEVKIRQKTAGKHKRVCMQDLKLMATSPTLFYACQDNSVGDMSKFEAMVL